MANLKPPIPGPEARKMGVAKVRDEYEKLAIKYQKIVDGELCQCHKCDNWLGRKAFYEDKRFKTGLFPICRECMFELATDYNESEKIRVDNREKTIEAFRLMNLPFRDSIYNGCLQNIKDAMGERTRSTAYQQMLVMVKTLSQYSSLTWKDSEFDERGNPTEEETTTRTPRKEIKKLFGSGFTNDEYIYLQDQYDDWCARTEVSTKPQQVSVIRICFKLLDIWKAQKRGDDTTKLDQSLISIMDGAKLLPKQNVGDSATDSLTFGQLIEKWEEEKPIPEPSEEFKDVDGISKYIRVWFTGWLTKALGLKANVFTKEYEEEIAKYEVSKPEFTEEGNAEEIYDRLFGSEGGE